MSIDHTLQEKYDAISVLASFGEQVTFMPKATNVPRTLTAVLERRDDVRDSGNEVADGEACTAMVLRDSTDATYGGIDIVDAGDSLLIVGDPEERVFRWEGRISDKSTHVWTLHFVSQKNRRYGANARA